MFAFEFPKVSAIAVLYPSVVLFIYLGFYVAFNTVQVISRRVVGRAEETSTYSSYPSVVEGHLLSTLKRYQKKLQISLIEGFLKFLCAPSLEDCPLGRIDGPNC